MSYVFSMRDEENGEAERKGRTTRKKKEIIRERRNNKQKASHGHEFRETRGKSRGSRWVISQLMN